MSRGTLINYGPNGERIVGVLPDLTPEEIDRLNAANTLQAKFAARMQKLTEIKELIKAGTQTNADIVKAVRLIIGVILQLTPEDSEIMKVG